MNVAVVFTGLRGFHLYKDVGQLGAAMHRAGARVTYLYSTPDEVRPIEKWFAARGIATAVVPWYGSRLRQVFAVLTTAWRESRRQDAWLLYHLTLESLVLASLIKLRSWRCRIVLKTDMDERAVAGLLSPARGRVRLHRLLHRLAPIDAYTVESTRALRSCFPYFESIGRSLVYEPIGFDAPERSVASTSKEKMVLHVGRLGMPQKNSESFLGAVALLGRDAWAGWRVLLVGPPTDGFLSEYERMLDEHPWMRETLVHVDASDDRRLLLDLFQRGFALCHTARWESFGLVLLEATAYGCGVVTTNVGAAADILEPPAVKGILVDPDEGSIADGIHRILLDWPPTDELLTARYNAAQRFSWLRIGRDFLDLMDGPDGSGERMAVRH